MRFDVRTRLWVGGCVNTYSQLRGFARNAGPLRFTYSCVVVHVFGSSHATAMNSSTYLY
jgi:hypothetical protein